MAKNYNLYLKIYQNQGIYKNFSGQQILNSKTKNLLGYYRNKNILDQNFYSEQAQAHLKDVKSLLTILDISSLITTLVVVLIIVILLKKRQKDVILKNVLIGASAAAALTIITATLVAFSFQTFFWDFHKVLFRNNYWLFDETDNLIKMFPERFFVSFAYTLIANIMVTSLVLILVAVIVRKSYDKPNV